MGKGLVIFGGIFGVFIVGLIVLVMALIGTTNEFVRTENGIKAQYSDNQNIYDKMFKSFRETAQVPEMYANDLERVYKGAIQARYGENGSKALFQFIKEQNPTFDSSMYTKLQSMIEANRNQFAASQTTIVDKCRVYDDQRLQFPGSMVAGFFGFPKLDLEKHCKVVTSGRTEKAFDSKKDEEIKLR